MSSTPWRRSTVKLEVDAAVEHTETTTVPGGTPSAGTGKYWVRDDTPNVAVFTDDAGTDHVLNTKSQWQQVTTSTVGTGAGSETFTLATPISGLATNDQTYVEVLVIGEDQAAPGTNTFFTRELRTYYRAGGSITQWSVEVEGREQNRGFGTEITSVDLVTSGTSDVIVQVTLASTTKTIDWTVHYRTKETVADGLAAGAGGGGGGGSGTVTTVDKRGGSAITTSSASSGGGTATGTISMGIDSGVNIYLKVTANGNTTDSDIEFFRDSAKLDQVYQSLGVDAFTSPFADGTPWSLVTASNLESQSLHYTITNNGANASTYDIELLAHGE